MGKFQNNMKKRQEKILSPEFTKRLRSKWPRLTDEELNHYNVEHHKFYSAVQQEYGIPQEEIDRQIYLIEREMSLAA